MTRLLRAAALLVLLLATAACSPAADDGATAAFGPAPTATASGKPEIHYYRLAKCPQCLAYAEELRAFAAEYPKAVVVHDHPLDGDEAARHFAWWKIGEPREGLAFVRPDFTVEAFVKGFGFDRRRIHEELGWLFDALESGR